VNGHDPENPTEKRGRSPDHRDGVRLGGGTMICEFCEGQTVKKKVKRQHWLHGRLYIIENVEAEVCTECGERYFHATTLDEIDRILEAEHTIKGEMIVEVVSL
jgi:YgiT-type zinc finger domain-containing protein